MAMALLQPHQQQQQQGNWFVIGFEDDGGIYEVELEMVGLCTQPLYRVVALSLIGTNFSLLQGQTDGYIVFHAWGYFASFMLLQTTEKKTKGSANRHYVVSQVIEIINIMSCSSICSLSKKTEGLCTRQPVPKNSHL